MKFKLPVRDPKGHKGTFGRVLIIGGQKEMIGAPFLAGKAALRLGAGLVQVAVPVDILLTVLSLCPEFVGFGINFKNQRKLIQNAKSADAIVVGPGLGVTVEAQKILINILQLTNPIVVDADALNILSMQKKWPKTLKARCVLTPHPGEMERLLKLIDLQNKYDLSNDEDRITAAKAFATKTQQVVVLKGSKTVVTDGVQIYINKTGNSSLAKAGCGDVLSGMIGTLLAQKMDNFTAASFAVYMHGLAGESAGRKYGVRSVLASEVIDSISSVIKKV